MSEHNPELCARVARVMGGRVGTLTSGKLSETEWAGSKITCMVLWDDATSPVTFRPDTDPADAWRVLAWYHRTQNHSDQLVPWADLWWLQSGHLMLGVCEMVAALGGEE